MRNITTNPITADEVVESINRARAALGDDTDAGGVDGLCLGYLKNFFEDYREKYNLKVFLEKAQPKLKYDEADYLDKSASGMMWSDTVLLKDGSTKSSVDVFCDAPAQLKDWHTKSSIEMLWNEALYLNDGHHHNKIVYRLEYKGVSPRGSGVYTCNEGYVSETEATIFVRIINGAPQGRINEDDFDKDDFVKDDFVSGQGHHPGTPIEKWFNSFKKVFSK